MFVNKEISNQLSRELAQVTFIYVKDSDSLRDFHPSTSRWVLFNDYLLEKDRFLKFQYIWLIDVRDSYFQADPFLLFDKNAFGNDSFHVFVGNGKVQIENCGWNGPWIKDCFSSNVYNNVKSHQIICSGVSAGSVNYIMRYLSIMSSIVKGIPVEGIDAHNFPSCERNGVDQGIHNVIVHLKLIPKIIIHQETGLVGNADYSRRGPFVVNMQASTSFLVENSVVFDSYANAIPVVHQYDRNYDLHLHLVRKYFPSKNLDDFVGEFKSNAQCKSYALEEGVDFFKGVCDYKAVPALTPSECCAQCSSMISPKTCQAFGFLHGRCFLKNCGSMRSYIETLTWKKYKTKRQDVTVQGAFFGYLLARNNSVSN